MQATTALRVVDDLPPEVRPAEELRSGAAWGPVRKLLFRFAFVYLILFCFPFPLDYIPAVQTWQVQLGKAYLPWVAKQVFDVTPTVHGGGDSTFRFIQLFCILVASIVATSIWTLLDRKRRDYARLYEWLRVYVRFMLAVTIIEYGAWKVIPTQFPAPTADRLTQPFGDASPMGLLWTFMGASVPYTIFGGLGEVVGGLLLTVRRTTLLGALICMGVLSNVVMLNFSYDVPVKVFSTHLLLMAVFLAAHDLRRLANLLVLNRPTEPEEIRPLFRRRWLARAATAFAAVFTVFMTGMVLYASYRDLELNGGEAEAKAPLHGMWTVEEFAVDGEVRPPLLTDETRWRRMFFTGFNRCTIQLMSDSRERFFLELDEKGSTLAMTKRGVPNWTTTLAFARPEPDVLLVEGPFDGKQVRALLRRTQPPEFLLVTHGFHLINDRPLNR